MEPERGHVGTEPAEPCPPPVIGNQARISVYGKKVLPESSFTGPALAAGYGRLYIAWTGLDQGLNVRPLMLSPAGITYGEPATFPRRETSIAAPALAMSNNVLYIAWTGTDRDRSINLMRSPDGMSFGNKKKITQRSIAAPALAPVRSTICLGWTGTDSDNKLNLVPFTDRSNVDPENWLNFGTLITYFQPQLRSLAGPALANGNSQLYLAWTPRSSPININVMYSPDGGNSGCFDRLRSEETIAAPALAGDIDRVAIAWTGMDSEKSLNVTYSNRANDFGLTSTLVPETSIAAPALAFFNGQIVMAWTGRDPGNTLNVAVLTG